MSIHAHIQVLEVVLVKCALIVVELRVLTKVLVEVYVKDVARRVLLQVVLDILLYILLNILLHILLNRLLDVLLHIRLLIGRTHEGEPAVLLARLLLRGGLLFTRSRKVE